jgi:copper chaperone
VHSEGFFATEDAAMIAYRIDDMTCGGCVRAIRAAVSTVAPGAALTADVEARTVRIEGGGDAARIEAAIVGAGFAPTRIDAPAAPAMATGCGGGGGGCGCAGG